MPGLADTINSDSTVDGGPAPAPEKPATPALVQPAKSILKSSNSGTLADEPPAMRRNISWQDFHGNQSLTQVHHFEPSESGSYDDDDAPEGKQCCVIS